MLQCWTKGRLALRGQRGFTLIELANLPSVTAGWTPSATYAFTGSTGAATFNISAVGDGATVSVP